MMTTGTTPAAGTEVDGGLTSAELDGVENRFGFEFAPEHRAMLSAGVPVGPERFPNGPYPDWPRWGDGNEQTLRRRLDAPVEWLLPDDGGPITWWHRSWGDRPADTHEALAAARAGLMRWPTLVPIYAHRFMPAAPAPAPAPVLSVHGSDIILYGSDLLDYLHNEFVRPRGMTESEPFRVATPPLQVHPWTDLDSGDVVIENG